MQAREHFTVLPLDQRRKPADMVPDDDELRAERAEWQALASVALQRAYAPDEPEYTDDDLIDSESSGEAADSL